MERKSNTKERILGTAIKLFYENGYSETGINEILEQSRSFKKSFYTHFTSKTDLGICYLRHIEKELLYLFQRMLTKYPRFEDFIHIWLKMIRNNISKQFSSGCPLINIPANPEELSFEAKRIFKNLKEPFRDYFSKNYKLPVEQCIGLSEEIMFLYEGAMNSYKLDPDKKYFYYMKKHLEYIAINLSNDLG